MNTSQLPEERECPRCHGRGTVDLPKGAISNAPAWSADEGRAKCGMCKGRGFVLKQAPRQKGGFFKGMDVAAPNAEYTVKQVRDLETGKVIAEQRHYAGDPVSTTIMIPDEAEPQEIEKWDDDQVGEPWAVPDVTYDPSTEARRIHCLSVAQAMVFSPFRSLEPHDVVGIARDMERFLRGD